MNGYLAHKPRERKRYLRGNAAKEHAFILDAAALANTGRIRKWRLRATA